MRVLVSNLGVGALGIWALVISAAQTARMFDPGAAAGAGRFLTLAYGEGDIVGVEKILAIMLYGTAPLYLCLSIVFYIPLRQALELAIQGNSLVQAQGLLIFAILSYVAQLISGIYTSALTNLHCGSLKSKIVIIGCLVQFSFSILYIKNYGLYGLALAQVSNYAFVTIVSIAALKMQRGVSLKGLLRWDLEVFRKVLGFGIGVQLTSAAWAGFEMSIRFIMAHFGGLEQIGYYEVAYKLSSQTRVLAFYLGQPLMPALVSLYLKAREDAYLFYKRIYARLVLFGLFSAIITIACSPLISILMFGKLEASFLFFCTLTAVGSGAHVAAMPSELAAIASGLVRFNLTGTVVALLTMLVLGCSLGFLMHSEGVALAAVVSSLLAAAVPIFCNSRKLELPLVPNLRRDLALRELLRPSA